MAVNYRGKKFYNIGPWRQATSTGIPLNKKVDKAEELTYLSTSIGTNDKK
jgi:hypothetical protein